MTIVKENCVKVVNTKNKITSYVFISELEEAIDMTRKLEWMKSSLSVWTIIED